MAHYSVAPTPAESEAVAVTSTERHPLSRRYDLDWLVSMDMGPNPLWQLEDLLLDVPVSAGMKVLDLGCGKGASSVFLARETGAQVTACDLWVPEGELRARLRDAGVGDLVQVVNADARSLPFEDAAFDAIVSIDAFEYFGTDVRALPGLLRVLKPGGRLGMSSPALRTDPYRQAPPTHVTDVVGWEAAAWHAPQWWVTHWSLSGLVRDVSARMQPGGRADWLAWCEVVGEGPDSPVVDMLRNDVDDQIGFVLASATKN